MKKRNLFTIIYFAVLLLAASMVTCSSSQHGYDYKTHHRKAHNAKPSKCYKQHNNW